VWLVEGEHGSVISVKNAQDQDAILLGVGAGGNGVVKSFTAGKAVSEMGALSDGRGRFVVWNPGAKIPAVEIPCFPGAEFQGTDLSF
jgi:hypothetical protein